jgi:hypothetical protein
MNGTDDADIVDGLRTSLRDAAERLRSAGARDEALAEYVAPRRVVVFEKKAVLVPLGRVWRLGVLLLAADGGVYATGSTTRALEPGRPAYQSESAEIRRAYRAAAFRGPFERGETVNFDATPIALDADALRASTGPLFLRDGASMVRWSPAADDGSAVPLAAYLDDRLELLIHPPEGA